jgi:hypothetical protein
MKAIMKSRGDRSLLRSRSDHLLVFDNDTITRQHSLRNLTTHLNPVLGPSILAAAMLRLGCYRKTDLLGHRPSRANLSVDFTPQRKSFRIAIIGLVSRTFGSCAEGASILFLEHSNIFHANAEQSRNDCVPGFVVRD